MKVSPVLCLLLVATPLTAETKYVPKQSVILDLAHCVVERDHSMAIEALKTEVGSKAEQTVFHALADKWDVCTNGRVFVSGQYIEFRGALAEAVISSEPERAARLNKLPLSQQPRALLTDRPGFDFAYADCIARSNPPGSMGLIATQHGSQAETDAVLAMRDTLMGCMPEGARYHLDVRDLRNHIAYSLFQLSEKAGA